MIKTASPRSLMSTSSLHSRPAPASLPQRLPASYLAKRAGKIKFERYLHINLVPLVLETTGRTDCHAKKFISSTTRDAHQPSLTIRDTWSAVWSVLHSVTLSHSVTFHFSHHFLSLSLLVAFRSLSLPLRTLPCLTTHSCTVSGNMPLRRGSHRGRPPLADRNRLVAIPHDDVRKSQHLFQRAKREKNMNPCFWTRGMVPAEWMRPEKWSSHACRTTPPCWKRPGRGPLLKRSCASTLRVGSGGP